MRRDNYSPQERLIADMREWRKKAACKRPENADIDFMPEPTADATVNHSLEQPAKKVCRTQCPVRLECMHHAITMPEEFGIWGGMNQRELLVAARDIRKLRKGAM